MRIFNIYEIVLLLTPKVVNHHREKKEYRRRNSKTFNQKIKGIKVFCS